MQSVKFDFPLWKIFFSTTPVLQQTSIVCTSQKKIFFSSFRYATWFRGTEKITGEQVSNWMLLYFFSPLCVERHLGVTIFKKGQNSIRLGDKSILHASWAGAGYKFTRSRKCNKARFSFFSLDLHINVYTVVVVVYDSHLLSPHHQRKWTDSIVDQFHWYQTLPHPLRTKLRSFFFPFDEILLLYSRNSCAKEFLFYVFHFANG